MELTGPTRRCHVVECKQALVPYGCAAHIAGHRIGVSHIAIWIVYNHESPDQVADEFGLSLGEVHAALAYYYDHREEIDRDIAETDRRAEEMAKRYPHRWLAQETDNVRYTHA